MSSEHLLETNDHPRGYVGFEPSGIMHAGTGLIVGKKMRDFVDAGFHFIIYPRGLAWLDK